MTINRLSLELKQLREIHGYSLRKVEEATGISNAYLSQLERGDAAKPSPEKLARLAEFYKVTYEQLMELAGYLNPMSNHRVMPPRLVSTSKTKTAKVSVLRQALMNAELSADEETLVADYISFLKTRSKRSSR
jgi:transcriptional regulator with XRE-family HTH domain